MLLTRVIRTAALLFGIGLLCCNMRTIQAQENIMPQIPPSLAECYNTSYFMNRDNRLPATMETLISLIEKVENADTYTYDIRTLSVALLQRFRQDGIQRAYGVNESPGVIPYSPTGFQFPKFRILLSRLIPGNAFAFPNNTLTRAERCSLHFMLSSSFDMRVRGDERTVCSGLSQYRAQRLRRAANNNRNNFIGDVEMLDSFNGKTQKHGVHQNGAYNSFDYDGSWTNSGSGSNTNQLSECPVENGVIWTPWGTITGGTLIAGIATGLQPQTVQLRTLLALSSRQSGTRLSQVAAVNVDNRWAATLAGDLAEVALVQVPFTTTQTATVGANGVWNSTVMPKWYFLTRNPNMEMTDAEIRGGLDGLIIAKNILNWRSEASNIKLSQLLRMYYSMNGVLSSGIKACNRKDSFQTYASSNEIIAQTSAFSQVLDREMQLSVTISPDNIAQFSSSAANALLNYIPNSLNDVTCSVSQSATGVTDSITPITNIYVCLDTTWQYRDIVDYVYYILQRLNVNPFASSVTLIAANDGSIIVNTTNYLTDIYDGWNVTTQAQYSAGFNLPTVLRTVQNLTQSYMNAEKAQSSVGGRSLIALLIPYSNAQVSSSDSSYATTQLQYIYEQVPDLRFIYYTSGTVNRFASFVRDPSQDLFTLNDGNMVASSSAPVVTRIKQIPRRLINPRCGASWSKPYTWGTDRLTQYISSNGSNFYRMMPNYFYGAANNRNIAIQSTSGVQFTICTSRTVPLPTQNNSTTTLGGSTDINCATIGNGFSYDLTSDCHGYSYIGQCPPLYVSVQAPASLPTSLQCSDAACQTPNDVRYVISVTNLDCNSGVAALLASLGSILLAYFLREALQ